MMKKLYVALIVVSLSLVLLAGSFVPAYATTQTVTVVSDGTSTFTAGSTIINPIFTPLDPTIYSLGSFANPAVPVSTLPSLWFGATTGPFSGSGAVWVSTLSTDGAGAPRTGDSWQLFEVPIDIQPGSTGISGNLWFTADNAVNVYLNGVLISSTFISSCASSDCVFGVPAPGPPYYDTSLYFFQTAYGPVSLALNAGSNKLDFVVRNWDNGPAANPTGLLFKADITFTPPPLEQACFFFDCTPRSYYLGNPERS